MLQIKNKNIIQAAFDVALFDINNANVNKHFEDRYKPLVSSAMRTRWQEQDKCLICNFTNNKIFAIGEGDDIRTLKTKNDMSIELHKDFKSFDEAVEFFKRTIHHKIFNSNNKNEQK